MQVQPQGPNTASGCSIHGLILAGGLSTRMGTDKATLLIDGEPQLLRLTKQLLPLTSSLIVASGTAERAGSYRRLLGEWSTRVRFAGDHFPGRGPMAGIHAGLSALPSGYVFVIACDMPVIIPSLLDRLLSEAAQSGAAIIHAKGHPFHALYHTRVTECAYTALERNNLSIMDMLRSVNTSELIPTEEEANLLHNLNTPAEYDTYIDANR